MQFMKKLRMWRNKSYNESKKCIYIGPVTLKKIEQQLRCKSYKFSYAIDSESIKK